MRLNAFPSRCWFLTGGCEGNDQWYHGGPPADIQGTCHFDGTGFRGLRSLSESRQAAQESTACPRWSSGRNASWIGVARRLIRVEQDSFWAAWEENHCSDWRVWHTNDECCTTPLRFPGISIPKSDIVYFCRHTLFSATAMQSCWLTPCPVNLKLQNNEHLRVFSSLGFYVSPRLACSPSPAWIMSRFFYSFIPAHDVSTSLSRCFLWVSKTGTPRSRETRQDHCMTAKIT